MASTARTIIHKRRTSYKGEVIIEFSSRLGQEHSFQGGLISIRPMADGTVRVKVYREDAGVKVVCDARHHRDTANDTGHECSTCQGAGQVP